MACAQQAVLEFDEEILAPWRPRLVAVAGPGRVGAGRPRPHSSGRSSSRVGICRPSELSEPAGPSRPRAKVHRTAWRLSVRRARVAEPGTVSPLAERRLASASPGARACSASPSR